MYILQSWYHTEKGHGGEFEDCPHCQSTTRFINESVVFTTEEPPGNWRLGYLDDLQNWDLVLRFRNDNGWVDIEARYVQRYGAGDTAWIITQLVQLLERMEK